MLIRKMTEADLDEVCVIEQETFSEPWSKDDFCKALRDINNGYLVAEVRDEIIGYCGYWGIAGEGNIYNMAVKKEYRRQCIGFYLLEHLIKEAVKGGISSFTLEVRSSNEAAIRLYERLGFQATAIRKDFYTKPKEDAVIMWLGPIQ
ncbi:ribosomal protein S18-alanine N-acetyltransferase [Mobilitalea sibirica]|nr:ribosomal protein S18-alanine N-acetyltransferase [Mobilitalea sibirica]